MQRGGTVVVHDTVRAGRVLVVDDNDVVREVLHEFLSPLYHVDGATSVAEALQSLTDQPPDLILLDLRLPGTDGMTLLKSLRANGVTTPVIMMTGYATPAVADEARHYGLSGFLAKPFNLRQLDRLIADAIHCPAPQRA